MYDLRSKLFFNHFIFVMAWVDNVYLKTFISAPVDKFIENPSETALEFKNRNSKTQKNYYTHQGDQDYMLSTQDQFGAGGKAMSNMDHN